MTNKLVVISSFPPYGITHHKAVVGVASYAKNTLSAIQKTHPEVEITVLAEELENFSSSYKDDGINVKRIWRRNSFLSFPKLLKEILVNQRDVKNILIEFEVSMFGNMFLNIPLPFFNFILKILDKNVTLVSHQVIENIKEFEGHVNLESESYKADILNFLIRTFYILTILSVNKVIVFDQELKSMLPSSKQNKIKVIPHGVENFNNLPSKEKARKSLKINSDDFIILNFGFLAWYKGTDWLVENFKNIGNVNAKRVSLIIAGGPNPNHKNKVFYQKYVQKIEKDCQDYGITLTGFVPEDKISSYFMASDLIILPYRNFMSASGPLSLAYSFGKPVIVSENISEIFQTPDIKNVLIKLNLDPKEIIFKLDNSFEEFIKKIILNDKKLLNITKVSEEMKKERSWNKIGKLYKNEIFF